MSALFHYQWDGESMVPLPHFRKRCDDEFVIGETYPLAETADRSLKSHSHYFACVGEAWKNLPELEAEHHPTAEHLRKYALIRCGYADERSIVCASKAEAQRVAAFIKPMDEYAVVVVRDCVVKVFTAQSQSKKAMGAETFQASKQAVLDYLDDLIGVERGETSKHVRAA